jgi:uncharacterized membrane protein YfcA
MSEIVGFALAVLIGITLGMLGGGGSILTVPVFVYVLGLAPKDAIAMSLPVVATTSFVGAAGHWRAGNVDGQVVLTFAPLAMLGALGGAWLAALVSGAMQLTLLGVVMLVAGVLMLRERGALVPAAPPSALATRRRNALLAATGLGVGLLTGLVGVGGGFMIVPALVLVGAVPMKRAVGTSLVVIALSTLSGLAGYHGQASISWGVVALFTGLAVAGTLVGTRLVRILPARGLRRAFGVVVLSLALFLLYENRDTLTHPARRGAPDRGAPR